MQEFIIRRSEKLGEIRLVLIDNNYYAVVADIKRALGAKENIQGFTKVCKKVLKHSVPTNGGNQLMNVIPVKEIERLMYSSRSKNADEFEVWAENELFPFMK